jgi:hypothetical protein
MIPDNARKATRAACGQSNAPDASGQCAAGRWTPDFPAAVAVTSRAALGLVAAGDAAGDATVGLVAQIRPGSSAGAHFGQLERSRLTDPNVQVKQIINRCGHNFSF